MYRLRLIIGLVYTVDMVTETVVNDTRAARAELLARGYTVVTTTDQRKLLVTHADASGRLVADLLGTSKPDMVVSCYPANVAQVYPGLVVCGDWAEETGILWRDGSIVYAPRNEFDI